MNNDLTEEQNIANDPSTVEAPVETPRKKTMTPAALEANRANAKKGTGPKTSEGKFKSCLNAMKHGLYSDNLLVKTEDAEVYGNVSASFVEEFKPTTPSELELLEQLIATAWRRRRVTAMVQQRINNAIDEAIEEIVNKPGNDPEPTPAQLTAIAMERLEKNAPSFARLEAYELRLCNLFHRILSRFYSMRDKKLRNETKYSRDALLFAA